MLILKSTHVQHLLIALLPLVREESIYAREEGALVYTMQSEHLHKHRRGGLESAVHVQVFTI